MTRIQQRSSFVLQLNTPPRSSPSPISFTTPSLASSPKSSPLTTLDTPAATQDAIAGYESPSAESSLKKPSWTQSIGVSEQDDYNVYADTDIQNIYENAYDGRNSPCVTELSTFSVNSERPHGSAGAVPGSLLSGTSDAEPVEHMVACGHFIRSSSPLRSRKIRKTAAIAESEDTWKGPVETSLSSEDEPVRRSSRTRMKPLEYWKNERIIYNLVRDVERGEAVPTIKSVIRASPEIKQEMPESNKKSILTPLGNSAPRLKRRRDAKSDMDSNVNFINACDTEGIVAEVEKYSTGERIRRRVAVPSTSLSYITVCNESSNFEFAKTFEEEGGFIATGIVRLPANAGSKGCRRTRANSLVFCVLEGTVRVVLNQEVSFKIERNGHFLVPRGNSYSLENAGRKMAVLFYTQGTDSLYNALEMQQENVQSL
ncbi:Mif2/CENP-C like-domain-containing protein [Lipomyces kononenkoae]